MNRIELKNAEVSKAIKSLLNKTFPQTKFSVKYTAYSGGNHVDVEYNFGPSIKEVKNLVKPFEKGWFKSTENLYIDHVHNRIVELNGNIFILDGGVKFVHVNKSWPDSIAEIREMAKTIDWGFDEQETVLKIRKAYSLHDFKSSDIDPKSVSIFKKQNLDFKVASNEIGFNATQMEKPIESEVILEIVQYSEYSIAVFGATYAHASDLKKEGGRYNKFLTHPHTHEKAPGWIFKLSQREMIRTLLKIA